MKDKYIVLIVGESGSGKSTICDELTKRYGLKQVKSYTTRPRRSEDEDGHTFISDEEFKELEGICGQLVCLITMCHLRESSFVWGIVTSV